MKEMESEGEEAMATNVSMAMRVMRREKKSGKVPFLIDMAALVAVTLTVTLSTILILAGF